MVRDKCSESLAITVRTSPHVLKTTRCYPLLPSGDLEVSTAKPTMRLNLAHRRTVGRLGACQELRWLWYLWYQIYQSEGCWFWLFFNNPVFGMPNISPWNVTQTWSPMGIFHRSPIPLGFSRNSFSRKHVLLPLKQPLMKPFLTKMERRLETQI